MSFFVLRGRFLEGHAGRDPRSVVPDCGLCGQWREVRRRGEDLSEERRFRVVGQNEQVAAYGERYECRAMVLREHPRCLRALVIANRLLTLLFYGAYGALLLVAALHAPLRLVPLVGIPAAAFGLVSLFRRRFNAPRPYECCAFTPLIPREGAGRSFPSRHAFSAFAIATCWFVASAPVAVALMACAGALGWCRVLGGVHFPRDIVAGALAGILAGAAACAVALLVA